MTEYILEDGTEIPGPLKSEAHRHTLLVGQTRTVTYTVVEYYYPGFRMMEAHTTDENYSPYRFMTAVAMLRITQGWNLINMGDKSAVLRKK